MKKTKKCPECGKNIYTDEEAKMKETYVRLKQASEQIGIDTYCLIDATEHKLIIGLTLVGFVPEDAEILGEFNEETSELTLFEKKGVEA